MGQLLKTELTREELENGRLQPNYIIVEAELTAEGKTTKGGIVVGHDEDVTFYSESESADNAHEADIAEVCSRVYKVPHKLYYNGDNQIGSMPWDCDMELQVGDMVWYSVLESRNAVTIVCDNKYFKLVPYQDVYCAKRTIHTSHGIEFNTDTLLPVYVDNYRVDILCLNGYVLLEPVYHKNTSSLAISQKGELDRTRGIIRYVGKCNREYLAPEYADFQNLEAGDEILLSQGTALILLERKKYLAKFDNDNLYFVVQRRRISLVLSKGN